MRVQCAYSIQSAYIHQYLHQNLLFCKILANPKLEYVCWIFTKNLLCTHIHRGREIERDVQSINIQRYNNVCYSSFHSIAFKPIPRAATTSVHTVYTLRFTAQTTSHHSSIAAVVVEFGYIHSSSAMCTEYTAHNCIQQFVDNSMLVLQFRFVYCCCCFFFLFLLFISCTQRIRSTLSFKNNNNNNNRFTVEKKANTMTTHYHSLRALMLHFSSIVVAFSFHFGEAKILFLHYYVHAISQRSV